MATVEALLTAEEYTLLPDNGLPTELVRGRIVTMNMPAPRHGYFCSQVSRFLGNYAEQHDLGRVMTNDSAVVTDRDPDTVRGADIAYYSYLRLPKGPLPEGYLPVVPEVVIEIRSPTDRGSAILAKVADYLDAGILAVGVLDPRGATCTVYREDQAPQVFQADQELVLPEFHADFRVAVRRFLE